MVAMCVAMKWDYFTFMAQPTWFLTGVDQYFAERAKQDAKTARKLKSKRR